MTAHPSGLVAEAFEAQRDRLRAVAYRVLGSHADAEDVVQEAWIRLARQDEATIANLAGWLTTVVGRISLDLLRSRRAHPETPYGQESADLVVTPADGPAPDDRRRWPTRSASPCWSCSTRSPRASAWRSSCTTCSRSRSRRSAGSWESPPTPAR
ncbi:sigma factor [Actinocorallia libanotica]|uniref:RNA polymerase sigma-70 region 2 domain-containing protein n=1 Tax=Actinocorallia libanotica TaxID=46162 RepID=A0ABP4AZE3_9ACTN